MTYEDESRLNYNPKNNVSKDKLNQYFSKKIEDEKNNSPSAVNAADASF